MWKFGPLVYVSMYLSTVIIRQSLVDCQQAGDRSKGVFYEDGTTIHNMHYAGFTCHTLKIGNLAYQLSRARRSVILSS